MMISILQKAMILIILLECIAFSSTGCQLIQEIETDEKPPKALPSLQQARSIEEIDHALEEIIKSEDAQIQVETLLKGWGRFGDWYDLAVVKYLWEHWPAYYGDSTVHSEKLIPIVRSRIEEHPELNRQVYWYTQWKFGVWEFPRLCNQVSNTSLPCVTIGGEEYRHIMFIAGLTNEPDKVLRADWEYLSLHWNVISLQFLALRPFLRYDDRLGHYVIDAEASKEHRYLEASKQKATPRKTPLPDWNHPVVPSPPRTDTISPKKANLNSGE